VNDERVIPLSRGKIALVILGSLLFVAAGMGFLLAGEDSSLLTELGRFASTWVVRGLGLATVLFFGGCGIYAICKLRDPRPGLTLSAAGLVDNSSAAAAGFVPWSEVDDVDVFRIQRQRMLVIHVTDPAKYIERGNAMRRALNRANAGMCGSPIVISSNAIVPTNTRDGSATRM